MRQRIGGVFCFSESPEGSRDWPPRRGLTSSRSSRERLISGGPGPRGQPTTGRAHRRKADRGSSAPSIQVRPACGGVAAESSSTSGGPDRLKRGATERVVRDEAPGPTREARPSESVRCGPFRAPGTGRRDLVRGRYRSGREGPPDDPSDRSGSPADRCPDALGPKGLPDQQTFPSCDPHSGVLESDELAGPP